ncbi:MAG: prenyltransferase/squalene oxidase repeat-containing protein [Thermodesulfobacteriota bacterium]|nr:prenyltransferase/squalene oxidase repeat-containing protein [Thermodesulfobacteriota bacterium]
MRKNKMLMVCLLLGVFICCAHTDARAGISEAAAYLEIMQNPDGSWGSDPSTIYFETTEVVKTLYSLGMTGDAYQRGVNFGTNHQVGGVEDHARKIDAIKPAGRDTTDDVNTILGAQNSDGGFGFDLEYGSNVYHTAFAMSAIHTAGISNPTVTSSAVNFITSRQQANGSFGLSADHDSIYLTALVALALTDQSGTSSAVDSAVDWLLTKQNLDGGFGETVSSVFETSCVSILLCKVRPDLQETHDALDYLMASQEPDGSFDNDPYQTAVAVQGIQLAYTDTHLFAGFNLFGFSAEVPEGYTSHDLIADLGSEVEKIQRYNPATETFQTTYYEDGIVTGDIFNVANGEGYFVYMKKAGTMFQSRRSVSMHLQLVQGFNIVSITGAPSCSSYDLLEYLGSSDEIVSIQTYNRETGAFETTAYYNEQPSGVSFDIVNGEAYLVHMKVAKEITDLFTPPEVVITSPNDGETVFSSPIAVSGTVDVNTVTVTVNGIEAVLSNGTFTAAGIPLTEGSNTITATAVGSNNITNTHTITVILEAGIDYIISKGGSISDSRRIQGDAALLSQAAGVTASLNGPSFIGFMITGAFFTAPDEIEISYTISIDSAAPEGIYDYQVEFGLTDDNGDPLEPLSNNIYLFKIKILP